MNKCLDYYRGLLKDVSPEQYGKSLYNIMNTYRFARGGRLSGMTFDGIDFGNVPLNNLHFSDDGENPTEFKNCKFHELNFMTGHSANVTHAEFSDNGKYVLSVDETDTFIFWETESGLQLGKYTLPEGLLEPGDEIMGIAFAGLDEKSQKPLKLMAYTEAGVCCSRNLSMSDDAAWTAEQLLTDEYADCVVITYSPDNSLALIRKAFTDEYLEKIKAEMLADLGAPPLEQEYWIYDFKGERESVRIWNMLAIEQHISDELLINEHAVFSSDNCCLAIKARKSVYEEAEVNIYHFKDEKSSGKNIENVGIYSGYVLKDYGNKSILWEVQSEIYKKLEEKMYSSGCNSSISIIAYNSVYFLTKRQNAVIVCDIETGRNVRVLGGNTGEFVIKTSLNRKYACCYKNGSYILLCLSNGKVLDKMNDIHCPSFCAVEFTLNSRYCVLINEVGMLIVYDVIKGKRLCKSMSTDDEELLLNEFGYHFSSWQFVITLKFFIISQRGYFDVLDIEKGEVFTTYTPYNYSCIHLHSASVSPNKSYLAYTTEEEPGITIHNTHTEKHRTIRVQNKKDKNNFINNYRVLDISDDGTEVLLVSNVAQKDEVSCEAEWWSTEKTPKLLRRERLSDDVCNYFFPKLNNYPTQSTNGVFRFSAQDGGTEKTLYLIPNLNIKGCRFIATKATSEVKKMLYQYDADIELAD